ncbi:hypothetical protein AB0D46_36295 [Streptomyces sp. NPDC048383]|uniref:hypothetical protein n=1 Tax=Streptomyces sp. NPDC048383 TaxID=3155386 RepID=UPI003417F85E
MSGLPQWLRTWFAENNVDCQTRGIDVMLWLRPADALPDRPGRKPTAAARVTAEAGDRWANFAVHEQGWATVLAMGDVTDAVWQAHIRPGGPHEVDDVLEQVLAWVASTSEVPRWAEISPDPITLKG